MSCTRRDDRCEAKLLAWFPSSDLSLRCAIQSVGVLDSMSWLAAAQCRPHRRPSGWGAMQAVHHRQKSARRKPQPNDTSAGDAHSRRAAHHRTGSEEAEGFSQNLAAPVGRRRQQLLRHRRASAMREGGAAFANSKADGVQHRRRTGLRQRGKFQPRLSALVLMHAIRIHQRHKRGGVSWPGDCARSAVIGAAIRQVCFLCSG